MDTPVGLILQAKDEASSVINKATGNVMSLHNAFSELVAQGGGLGQLAVALAGIGAAGTAAAINLTETVVQLERMHRSTSVGIEQLQTWRQVIREGGGDPDSLTTALVRLNRALGENGALVRGLHLDAKNTGVAFEQLMTLLKNTDPQNASAIAFKLLGRGAKELMADWGDLVSKSPEVEEALRRSGAMISPETAEKTKPLHAALENLKLAWKGLANILGEVFLPIATVVARALGLLLAPVGWLVSRLGELMTATHDYVASILKDASEGQAEFDRVTKGPGSGNSVADSARLMERGINVRMENGVAVGAPSTFGIEVSAARGHVMTPDEADEIEKRRKAIEELTKEFAALGNGQAWAGQQATFFFDHVKNGSEMARKAIHDLMLGSVGEAGTRAWEAMSKKADELQSALGLSTDQAWKYAEALADAAAETARLNAIKEINPALAESGDRIEKLAESMGLTKTHAHDLMLEMEGVRDAGADRSMLNNLISTDRAMQALQSEQKRRAQTSSMEPLLIFPGADSSVRGKTAEQLRRDTVTAMRETTQAAMTSVALLRSGLDVLQGGLNNGFNQVFQGFMGKMQTWSSAWTSLWKSMAQSALTEMGRIVSSQVFRVLLSILTYAVPGLGPALRLGEVASAGAGGGSSSGGLGSGGTGPFSRSAPVNVFVQTLDTRGAAQAFSSPRSEVRAAMRQIALGRAY